MALVPKCTAMNRVRHGTNVVNYRRELKELKSSFANLQAQHDRDAKKHDKIQGDLQKTKSTASKQAAVIKSLHRQNATLQSSNADLVRKLEGATERIRRLEAKLVCNFKDDREQPDLKRTVDAQAATIQTQSEKLATYEATIEATVEEIDVLSRALNIKVQEYRQQNAQETVQCTLLFEFARAQKDLQTLEQNLKEKTDHVDELLSQLEAAQTNVSELRTRNQHLERAVAQQQNKISEDNMNLVELREKKELVSAERQLLLDQIENISAERDRHRSAAERLVHLCFRVVVWFPAPTQEYLTLKQCCCVTGCRHNSTKKFLLQQRQGCVRQNLKPQRQVYPVATVSMCKRTVTLSFA